MLEQTVDKRISQAAEFFGKSDRQLKFTCIAASPVVGTYDGGTQEIAKRILRSVSTVENYAHAFWLYRDLRANGHKARVRAMWRSLPASHWWQAYDIHKAGYDTFYYLNNADLNKWSGRDMMFEYRRDREAGNAPLVFARAVFAFRGLADELLKSKTLTPKQRAALQAVREAFQ
jgi:hypothetical protein